MILKYVDNSILTIALGSLNYKNIDEDSIEIWGIGNLSIESNASLNIFENMYMERGSAMFFDNSTYAYKTGKEFKGNIAAYGNYNIIEF